MMRVSAMAIVLCVVSLAVVLFGPTAAVAAVHGTYHPSLVVQTPHRRTVTLVRGGGELPRDTIPVTQSAAVTATKNDVSHTTTKVEPDDAEGLSEGRPLSHAPKPAAAATVAAKSRHTSDLVLDLKTRSGVDDSDSSLTLRDTISERTAAYLLDLTEAGTGPQPHKDDDHRPELPHPKKLLHSLARLIPAIKQSPDVALRIRCAGSDIDAGIAACLLGTLGHVCEAYEHSVGRNQDGGGVGVAAAVQQQVVQDRRFEQLVECCMCGVDYKRRKIEWQEHEQRMRNQNYTSLVDDIAELSRSASLPEGLSIRDACRAAWGISILGLETVESIECVDVEDIFISLALRVRDLLLVGLQRLRQSDLSNENSGKAAVGETSSATIDERVMDCSEELAENAASAMWTFACVTACTGIRCNPLFDVCLKILCANPIDMRMREQESEASVDALSVGVNDIVERLAMSENEDIDSLETAVATDSSSDLDSDSSASTQEPMESLGNAEADPPTRGVTRSLIDYLSPKELTDVVWALALHGSAPEGLEAHASFLDVALEKLQAWLQQELDIFKSEKERRKDPSTIEVVASAELLSQNLNTELSGSNSTEVEYIDATELLKSEQYQKANQSGKFDSNLIKTDEKVEPDDADVCQETFQNISVGSNPEFHISTSTEVEYIDATELLKGEQNQNGKGIGAYEQNDTSEDESSIRDGSDESQKLIAPVEESLNESFQFFSAHDLCSVAWAVTEMLDTRREQITSTVAKIFSMAGPLGFRGLAGGDFSNLAWALAKNVDSTDNEVVSEELGVLLMGWIVSDVLQTGENFLDRFYPPELSRFLWAIASVYTSRVDGTRIAMAGIDTYKVGSVGLATAGSNLELFGTEDLARVVWAFLVLSENRDFSLSAHEAFALGKILASIESSLLQWEGMKSSVNEETKSTPESETESTRFASFFGRTRLYVPFLDHRVDDGADDGEDMPTMSQAGKSRLPLLRGLPIDPLTLCKIACCFERLASRHDGVRRSETLTRIALRLLTSRGGRLLRECPIQDVVRLCDATARTDVPSRRELASLFSRRVVQSLNDATKDSISVLGPGDVATLMWALGELGVKYSPGNVDSTLAHRRLLLVGNIPLLGTSKLKTLSTSRLAKLFRGLVTLQVAQYEKLYLINVVLFFSTKVSQITDGSVLCDIIQSVGALKVSFESTTENVAKSKEENPSSAKERQENDEVYGHTNVPTDTSAPEMNAVTACTTFLSILSERVVDIMKEMRAEHIQKVLLLHCLLPFRADGMVDAIEAEVQDRMRMIKEGVESNANLILTNLTSSISSFKQCLQLDGESESPTPRIWTRGFQTIFGSSGDDPPETTGDSTEPSSVDDVVESVHNLLSATELVESLLLKSEKSCHFALEDSLVESQRGVLFELGQCCELIKQYRRIDFESGARKSNIDTNQRRNMAKRVLSRHLPS